MTLRKILRNKDNHCRGRKWVIYYDDKDKIKEVRMLYNSGKDYDGHKVVYTDSQLIKKLDEIL